MHLEDFEAQDYQCPELKIKNDAEADRFLRRIKDIEEEKKNAVGIAEENIDYYKVKKTEIEKEFDHKINWYKFQLRLFIENKELSETKTEKQFKLISGKVYFKKAKKKLINADEQALRQYLIENEKFDYIENQLPKIKWGEFKKFIQKSDEKSISKIPGLDYEEVPEEFGVSY